MKRIFNKGRCNKSNDGCGESNSTVPKNSADEKNCADGAKLCTNETEPSASKGAESARMFCGIMNLPPPPTKFSKYNHILLQATRETCEHSMAEAVREAVDENDGKRDLAVAVDGSWQKRGFSSKNGLVTVTSVDTGKVLDESRSFFRVHTGYFSNVPKCIKAEFIASWGCSQSSVVSSSQR
ncbi:uncharacterized protein TNCV_5099111 [Trichonephila clavipes]|uniref:Mutator-like transposase domain-containing protein n=1 Tax=Trichonephila clavipes TaxID=2585209 RepID=A0A8X6S066_TRICX|nr:uncharacterized protein TNCV_5099111 [Trichonephila clavipes]